jgi:hypothetical protein
MSNSQAATYYPYTAPSAPLEHAAASERDLTAFPRFSAWGVFGLMIVTLGIYIPYWFVTRTRIANRILPDQRISSVFLSGVLILFVVSMLLSFASGIQPSDLDLQLIANCVGLASNICFLVWAFRLRARLHAIVGQDSFSGPATFFFGILYLQYKLNVIIDRRSAEAHQPQTLSADVVVPAP